MNEERQVESIAQTGEKIRLCFLDFLNPPEKEQRSEGLKTVFWRDPAVEEGWDERQEAGRPPWIRHCWRDGRCHCL